MWTAGLGPADLGAESEIKAQRAGELRIFGVVTSLTLL